MNEFHFLRPYWLIALVPCIVFLSRLFFTAAISSTWQKACDTHLLKHLTTVNKCRSFYLPFCLLSMAWLITVIALAGPTWSRIPQPVFRNLASRVILLDLSPAMNAKDMQPDRLTRAKYKIQDILKQSDEFQVGMIVFSEEPYTVSPLTEDAATLSSMIPMLNPNIMPTTGHNIAAALKAASKLIQHGSTHEGEILLISPGPVSQAAIDSAKKLSKSGIITSVLAIGTDKGAPVPTESGMLENAQGKIIISRKDAKGLQRLAKNAGGHFVDFTTSNRDLKQLLSPADAFKKDQKLEKRIQVDRWHDNGFWLIMLLLPLAALLFRRGWMEELLD